MKIDELPVELLMKIFSYLRTYKKVSLVNRKFYDVACKNNDKNILLLLDKSILQDEKVHLLQSIEKTNRKLTKVEISCWSLTEIQTRKALSIITKFSETLKYLKLKRATLETNQFLNVLASVPNAQHLEFDSLKVVEANKPQRLLSNNDDLNLPHLKILNFYWCPAEFQVLFNKLPAGVLKELTLYHVNLSRFKELFNRQTNISAFKQLGCEDATKGHILDNLSLESLGYCIQTSALSRQTKLKSLKLGLYNEVDVNLMKVVASRLTQLEKLTWGIGKTTVEDFVNIQQLENLKRLTLEFDVEDFRPDIVDAFTQLDNSRIMTLKITVFCYFSLDQMRALAKSVPKLKRLELAGCSHDWKQMSTILKLFNFVEFLDITGDVDNYDDYLFQRDSFNPNLTELDITFLSKYKRLFLKKIAADYPNLRKLALNYNGEHLKSAHFEVIVSDFNKLESLKLSHTKELTMDDFTFLQDHSNNLRFVSLHGLEKRFLAQYMGDIEAMFEDVNVNSYGHLIIKI